MCGSHTAGPGTAVISECVSLDHAGPKVCRAWGTQAFGKMTNSGAVQRKFLTCKNGGEWRKIYEMRLMHSSGRKAVGSAWKKSV